MYSQLRLISPHLIEHSRNITDFFKEPDDPIESDIFFPYFHQNNITSPNITEIQGPQRPNLSLIITLCFNWSEWTNQINGNFRWLQKLLCQV